MRETRLQRPYDSDDYPFPSTWVCVAGSNGSWLAIDTSPGDAGASPVYYVHGEFVPRPRLTALAHMFRLWAFCYEHGVYTPNEPVPEHCGIDEDKVGKLRMTPFWSFV